MSTSNVYAVTFYIIIIFSLCNITYEVSYRQEQARVIYQNPKYVTNAVIFTSRLGRGKGRRYATSVSCSLLHSWGNNVTTYFKYSISKTNNEYEVSLLLCKGLKEKWLREYVSRFMTTRNIETCPVPPGVYNLSDIEIPPKNFPFPLPKGVYHLRVGFFVTHSKEKIIEAEATVYVNK